MFGNFDPARGVLDGKMLLRRGMRAPPVPLEPDSGLKTFCADESGTLKFVHGGKSSTCFSRGELLNSTPDVPYNVD